jgi:ribonuclease HI
MKNIVIHTDGACLGNPGPGAWAAVLTHGNHRKELSGAVPATTNNRMEIQAAIMALQALKHPCDVTFYTDSKYLISGATDWSKGWKRSGWMTKSKKPVKNADLWKELDAAMARHKISWQWVKGHSGNDGNERCDLLANEAIAKLQSQMTPAQLRAELDSFVARQKPCSTNQDLLEIPLL